MERLKEIFIELFDFMKAQEINFNTDQVLECATKIYLTEVIGAQKNGGSSNEGPVVVEMASEAQKNYMKGLKIPHTDSMTKKEAHALIKAKAPD